MYQIIYPTYDATIYERFPDKNTGTDQILELTKTIGSQNYNSRILMKFPISEIIPSSSFTAYLKISATEAEEIPVTYNIFAYPVYGAWTNGTGFYNNLPEITNGVSWKYQSAKSIGLEWLDEIYPSNVTGSYATEFGGGNWYYNVSASQTFNYESPDIRMNVTNIVQGWIDSDYNNEGFILKFSDLDEQSSTILGSIKYFALDTHTIFVPRLEIFWNDAVLNTGSLQQVQSDDCVVYIKNLKSIYSENEKPVLRLGVRNTHPIQTYATSSNYLTQKRLPDNSYFKIMDCSTDEEILPFDSIGTKVNCDQNGNYIKLDMNGFMPEREYKIIIKSEFSDGAVNYIDDNYIFRVSRI